MSKKILSVATFGLVGSKLLGGKKKEAAAPTPSPITMPIADDEAVKRARRRSAAAQIGRGGRSSTILSDGSGGTLGG